MQIEKENDQAHIIVFSPEDVEIALCHYLAVVKPEYKDKWISNPKYNIGSVIFALTKGDE